MSSDSEFERFLEESLSASDTSSVSINSNENKTAVDKQATSWSILSDDKYWWNNKSSSDENNSTSKNGELKQGFTQLKSDTKLEQSSDDHSNHALHASSLVGRKQIPVTQSGSENDEDYTCDSLDIGGTVEQSPLSSEIRQSNEPEEQVLSQTSNTSKQGVVSEKETALENSSQRKFEKDYAQSSFESDSDDMNETLQPDESKPASNSSGHSSLSSVDKSVIGSVSSVDKADALEIKTTVSPVRNETTSALSGHGDSVTGTNLEVKRSESVSKDDKSLSASSSTSQSNHIVENSEEVRDLPDDKAKQQADLLAKDSVSLESLKPSLMVNSLDLQMAELQEALCAAGLPPIESSKTDFAPVNAENKVSVSSSPDFPEDIQQVLRELATQEVVSLSRKILHEKQLNANPAVSECHDLPSHEKLNSGMHAPLSDHNIVSSNENLLSVSCSSTQSEDEAVANRRCMVSVAQKKTFHKPTAKKESVFQRLSTPKSVPVQKKPPAVKRVPQKFVKRSRIATPSSQKNGKKDFKFDGQATYDLKSATDLLVDHEVQSEVVKPESSMDGHAYREQEQKLLLEIKNWQNSWKEEKEMGKQLKHQLEKQEREFAMKEEKMGLDFNREKHQLKQEIFILSSKVKELECETDSRKRVANGGQLDNVVSEEQRIQLELNIQEQETLLQGYQKENERVYEELTKARNELKIIQTRAFEENQQLAQQLANTKEELQKKDEQLIAAGKGGGALGIQRISQLETQLASVSTTCSQLDDKVAELEKQNASLKDELRRVSAINKQLREEVSVSISSIKLDEVKENLGSEIKHLKQQVKWYMENQQLFENNMEMVQKKDKEIAMLKEKLAKKVTDKKLAKDRATDATKIKQLEKQVKAMEMSIRQKYPDSITSLIYASRSAEDVTTPSNPSGYLSNRVLQLEQELEAKDKEMSLKIRCLHQKHTNMQVMYEEQIQSLKEELLKMATCETCSLNGCQPGHDFASLLAEVVELRKTCSMLEQERDALLAAQHVNVNSAEMTSLILKENTNLKSQLKQTELDVAHQKVKYDIQINEAEASMKQLQKTHDRELADIQKEYQLAMKQQSENSQSYAPQLKSQMATQQVTIAHLKEQLRKYKAQEQLLICTRRKEAKLDQELKLLREELLQATKEHTPEMHQFHSLLSRLNRLENRILQYETRLHPLLTSKDKPDDHLFTLQQDWAKKLRGKDEEIESFRKDLDVIIETLQLLHDNSN